MRPSRPQTSHSKDNIKSRKGSVNLSYISLITKAIARNIRKTAMQVNDIRQTNTIWSKLVHQRYLADKCEKAGVVYKIEFNECE